MLTEDMGGNTWRVRKLAFLADQKVAEIDRIATRSDAVLVEDGAAESMATLFR